MIDSTTHFKRMIFNRKVVFLGIEINEHTNVSQSALSWLHEGLHSELTNESNFTK
jgi:hypothetical protein